MLPKLLEQQEYAIDALISKLGEARENTHNEAISNQNAINAMIRTINFNSNTLFKGLGKLIPKEMVNSHDVHEVTKNEPN